MIRISIVSYLNSKPFLQGLKVAPPENISVSEDNPAECARKLIAGETDLGLVPVAILPQLKEAHILPGFCIGADGPVESVKLYSQVELPEIKNVWLDYQSKTSVLLARVLAKELWKISPRWTNAQPGFEKNISGENAGVVIGDRTFLLNNSFRYEFDLAEEWKKLTGLPFVFACWVSNKQLPREFISHFLQAMEKGMDAIPEIIRIEKEKYAPFDVENYLLNSLNFRLDARGETAIRLFLEKTALLKA